MHVCLVLKDQIKTGNENLHKSNMVNQRGQYPKLI